jgi:hypothetical protein
MLYIHSMKNLLTAFTFIVSLSLMAQTQKVTPQLLKEPADWSFERFELPPSFAPHFPYKGAEELRFSPGMFNKDSTNYFTYAFVAELENTTAISTNNIRDYLLIYFKGLCSSTANNRKLAIDTTKIMVNADRKKDTRGLEIIYNATLDIFGVFADGAPVKLNAEIRVLTDTTAKKTFLVFIASPLEKTNKAWQELYAIQKKFAIPK